MIEISDRLFGAYIGPGWATHYRDAFSRIEDGSRTGIIRSWNNAAAAVPFWFVYRGLTSWSVIFFLGLLVLYVVYAAAFTLFSWMRYELFWYPLVPAYVTVSIIQGFVADGLLHRLALRTINKVRRSAPSEATAIRELSALAPNAPPGAYVTHGLLMLVGIPIWGVAVWSGIRALAPNYSEPQSVYIALMRSTLRDLIVMQETFFVEAAEYSEDLGKLRYHPPEGVTVRLTSVSDSGWAATASHDMVALPCTIFVGRVEATHDAGEGIPFCP